MNKTAPIPDTLAEHIRQVVESAPPLSPEHAARLRALLPLPAINGTVNARAS